MSETKKIERSRTIIGAILILPLASIVRDLFRYFFDKAVDASLVIEQDPSPDAASGGS